MAQQLRVLAGLAGDPRSVPSTHRATCIQPSITLVAGSLTPSAGTRHTCDTHMIHSS